MAVEDDARALAARVWRIKRDRLEPGDLGIRDELGLDGEEWQRLRLLLDRDRSEEDDEVLLENWHTLKEEIVAGRIYGFIRANLPELSHELLMAADFSLGPQLVSVAEENALAELPFTFSSHLADEILSCLGLAGFGKPLGQEVRRALKRDHRRRIMRPVKRLLAYVGIVMLAITLWKLLAVVL
jgi:hypothetical protein